MDQNHFDQLTVAFAHGTSRRALLRLLGGGSLTALLSLTGFGHDPNVDAGRRAKHRERRNRTDRRDTRQEAQPDSRERKGQQEPPHARASSTCGKPGKSCCAPDDSCRSQLSCVDGVCRRRSRDGCSSGQVKCGGRCVDLGTDTNCGGCGDACPAPERCLDGTCGLASSCSDDLRNGDETDVDCGGACGATCANGQSCGGDGDCASGFCLSGACAPVSPCRDGIQNGTETDIDCGGDSCPRCGDGKKCRFFTDCAGRRCLSGTCQPWPVCPAGQEYCPEGNITECGPGCACATSLDTGVTVCGANSLRQCFDCATDEECTIRLGLVGFPNTPGICARDTACSCPGSTVCLPASCGCGSDGSLCG